MRKINVLAAGLAAILISAQASFAVAPPPPPPPDGPGAGPGPRGPEARGDLGGAMFERLDRNGDGVIDREEFRTAANQLRRRFAEGREGRGLDRPRFERRREEAPRRGEGDRRGPGRFERQRDGAGPGPEMGPPADRLREIVREAVREVLHENEGRLHELVRDAVQRAMHGDRGKGPAPREGVFEMRRGIFRDQGRGQGRGQAGAPRARGRFEPMPGPDGMMPPPAEMKRRGPRGDRDGMPAKAGRGKAGGAGRPGAKAGRGDGMRMFDRLDANHDGVITRDEFKGNDKRFSKLDANGDGRIDRQEMRSAAKKIQKERDGRGQQPKRRAPMPPARGVSI